MKAVRLGSTGIDVSEFFFGAGAIGGIGSAESTRGRGLTVDEGRQRLDEAYAMGIKVIDTANSYAGGESERTVGRWLSDTGADVVVTTKVGGRVEPGQHDVSLRADHIGRQLVRSIERLGRVDLYLSHGPDESTSVAETLSAFAAAQQAGLIRAFGCSNVDAAQLEELLRTADRLGIQRPGWVQNGFSLLARQDERDLLPLVRSEGLGYTPFSPLAGGLLSDRYLSGAPPEPGSRIDVAGVMYADANSAENLERVAELAVIARKMGVSTSALALAWLRSHPAVTAPIVSPRTAERWTAVREAVVRDLDGEIMERISDLFPPSAVA